jgi:hypothetical protein
MVSQNANGGGTPPPLQQAARPADARPGYAAVGASGCGDETKGAARRWGGGFANAWSPFPFGLPSVGSGAGWQARSEDMTNQLSPAPWRGFLCACRLGRNADTATNPLAPRLSRGLAGRSAFLGVAAQTKTRGDDRQARLTARGFLCDPASDFRHRNQEVGSVFELRVCCLIGKPHDACRHLAPPRSGGAFSPARRETNRPAPR